MKQGLDTRLLRKLRRKYEIHLVSFTHDDLNNGFSVSLNKASVIVSYKSDNYSEKIDDDHFYLVYRKPSFFRFFTDKYDDLLNKFSSREEAYDFMLSDFKKRYVKLDKRYRNKKVVQTKIFPL